MKGQRLVVGVPDGHCPSGLLSWVAATARAQACPVLLVHGWFGTAVDVPETGFSPAVDVELRDATVAQLVENAAVELRGQGVSAAVLTSGEAGATAMLSVLRLGDTAVVGAAAGDVVRRLHGNVVHKLVRRAPCAVVVVPADWQAPATSTGAPIVLGYDGTPRCENALRWAIASCSVRGVGLILAQARVSSLSFALDGTERADILARVSTLAADGGVFDVSAVDAGDANHGLARRLELLAQGAELLVLGNHRASWLAEAAGISISEHASVHARCPVALVPSEPAMSQPSKRLVRTPHDERTARA